MPRASRIIERVVRVVTTRTSQLTLEPMIGTSTKYHNLTIMT